MDAAPGEKVHPMEAAVEAAAPPESPRKVAIRTNDLTKAYGGKLALDALNIEILEGEVFGYIGPNGAGKTTTIRILSALLLPTRGTAEICGVDVVRHPRKIKEIVGYMPDSFGVYENMTLLEYLDFFGAAFRIPRSKRRKVIDDVLLLTDLGSKRDDMVSVFSRGMKQRACLAKTLLHDPKVLILDEPASGLDPRARVELRELLRELQKMGKTIIVSSHILTELSSICTTVGILEAGRLVAAGAVRDILKGLRSQRELSVDLLHAVDSDRAVRLIETLPGVRGVKASGAALRITLEATDREIAAIAAALAEEKVPFTSFREDLADLETAFMTLTQGKLA